MALKEFGGVKNNILGSYMIPIHEPADDTIGRRVTLPSAVDVDHLNLLNAMAVSKQSGSMKTGRTYQNTPRHTDRPSVILDRASQQSDRRSVQSDRRSVQSDRRSAQSDRRSVQSDRRSAQPDRRSAQPDRRSAQSDRRSAQSDRRSALSTWSGRQSKRTGLAIYDSDFYDTDVNVSLSSDDEAHDDTGCEAYKAACRVLYITPSRKAMDQLASKQLHLPYRNMGLLATRALTTALAFNHCVESVDLQENNIGGQGAVYIADLIKHNKNISKLNLCGNNVGTVGAHAIGGLLVSNTTITHLNLARNNLTDSDAHYLADGIQVNEKVTHLDLSHNGFSEKGAKHLGKALGNNNFVEVLDLSWNNIRRAGAVSVCRGLKRNYCLSEVDLSWNGFGYEGSLALGEAIKVNNYIRELNVSSNRINWQGANLIAKGLKHNDTLEVFKIGHNPITMTGCLDILDAVDNPNSVLNHLGLNGITVSRRILYVTENLQKRRPEFVMVHGGLTDSHDVFGKRKEVLRGDPLSLLINYLNDKSIRPVDLFRTFDKDQNGCVSRNQFISGLKKAKVPLTDFEIQSVLRRLNIENDKISYRSLSESLRSQMVEDRKERKYEIAKKERVKKEHRRIMESGIAPAQFSLSSPGVSRMGSLRLDSAATTRSMMGPSLLGSIHSEAIHNIHSLEGLISSKSSLQSTALDIRYQTMSMPLPRKSGSPRSFLSFRTGVRSDQGGILPIINTYKPLISHDHRNHEIVKKKKLKKKKKNDL